MKIVACLAFLCFLIKPGFAQTSDNQADTFKQQRLSQGELHLSKAAEFYKDGQFKNCIDKINDFLFLFPGHPSTLRALKLLSLAYKKNDQIEESIRTDILIYRENPTTEDGLVSYLDAGKKLLIVGKLKEGKKILEIVKNQLYSSKIAKDAEIELKQNAILEEDGFQIKEEMNKE
jgi:hypothetical protein